MSTSINIHRVEDVEIIHSTSKHTPTHYTDIVVTSVDGSQIKLELFSDSALKIKEKTDHEV